MIPDNIMNLLRHELSRSYLYQYNKIKPDASQEDIDAEMLEIVKRQNKLLEALEKWRSK